MIFSWRQKRISREQNKKFSYLVFVGIALGCLGAGWGFYKFFLKTERGQISAGGWSYIQRERLKAQKEFAEFIKTPAGKIWEKHPYWNPETCQKIAQGEISPGMTREQVKESLAQKPQIKIKVKAHLESEEWIVEGEKNLIFHFQNGILKSWQKK